MDDYDAEFDREASQISPARTNVNGDIDSHQTPYGPSFVLPLTALHPGVVHPMNMAFLYEYREPTFGILYSTIAASTALGHERKDAMLYAVFTLDLDQRASTMLLSISKLPNDLFDVVPLPLPVGGALLVGTNELIHVDQGGKTNSIGVNEFARKTSSFPMVDLSDSRMRLEGCRIEQLNASSGDMLIVLADGDWAVLSFRLDGRSVSGMSIKILPREHGRIDSRSRASCIASLGSQCIFLGSEVADSVLLSAAGKPSLMKKHSLRSGQRPPDNGTIEAAGDAQDDEEEEEDEDDLYGESVENSTSRQSYGVNSSATNVRILDRLHCMAPLRDVTIGHPVKRKRYDDSDETRGKDSTTEKNIVVSSGQGLGGGVTILNRRIWPEIVSEKKISRVNGVWSLSVKRQAVGSLGDREEKRIDEFVIVSKYSDHEQAESKLYQVTSQGVQEKIGTDFDPSAGGTIECGLITNGAHIVQVLEAQIIVYDQGKALPRAYCGTAPLLKVSQILDLSRFGRLWMRKLTQMQRPSVPASQTLTFLF